MVDHIPIDLKPWVLKLNHLAILGQYHMVLTLKMWPSTHLIVFNEEPSSVYIHPHASTHTLFQPHSHVFTHSESIFHVGVKTYWEYVFISTKQLQLHYLRYFSVELLVFHWKSDELSDLLLEHHEWLITSTHHEWKSFTLSHSSYWTVWEETTVYLLCVVYVSTFWVSHGAKNLFINCFVLVCVS